MSGEAGSRSSCSTILLPPGQINGERGDTETRRTLRRASLPHRLLPSPLRDLDAHEMGAARPRQQLGGEDLRTVRDPHPSGSAIEVPVV